MTLSACILIRRRRAKPHQSDVEQARPLRNVKLASASKAAAQNRRSISIDDATCQNSAFVVRQKLQQAFPTASDFPPRGDSGAQPNKRRETGLESRYSNSVTEGNFSSKWTETRSLASRDVRKLTPTARFFFTRSPRTLDLTDAQARVPRSALADESQYAAPPTPALSEAFSLHPQRHRAVGFHPRDASVIG